MTFLFGFIYGVIIFRYLEISRLLFVVLHNSENFYALVPCETCENDHISRTNRHLERLTLIKARAPRKNPRKMRNEKLFSAKNEQFSLSRIWSGFASPPSTQPSHPPGPSPPGVSKSRVLSVTRAELAFPEVGFMVRQVIRTCPGAGARPTPAPFVFCIVRRRSRRRFRNNVSSGSTFFQMTFNPESCKLAGNPELTARIRRPRSL
jgi:hypothetical protein